MFYYTLFFLVITIIAAFLGFGVVVFAAAGLARIAFYIFLIMFLVSLITQLFRRHRA